MHDSSRIWVLVMANNAIFAGSVDREVYDAGQWHADDVVEIRDARWCYYWVHPGGQGGLAADGPRDGSRIGAPCTIRVRGVLGMIDASLSEAAWRGWP